MELIELINKRIKELEKRGIKHLKCTTHCNKKFNKEYFKQLESEVNFLDYLKEEYFTK